MDRESQSSKLDGLAWLRKRAWDRCETASLEQAQDAWEEVLRRAPRDPVTLNNLAAVAFHRDLMDEAVRHLSDSLAALPEHGFLWASLGWVYWHAGRVDGSRHAFRAAVAAAPMFEDYGLGEEDVAVLWSRRCPELDEETLGRSNLNLMSQSRARLYGAITLRDPGRGWRRVPDRPDITLPRLLRRIPRFTDGDPGDGGSLVPRLPPPTGLRAKNALKFPEG